MALEMVAKALDKERLLNRVKGKKKDILQPGSQGLFLNWGRENALASAGLFCNPIGSFKLSIKSFKSIIYS